MSGQSFNREGSLSITTQGIFTKHWLPLLNQADSFLMKECSKQYYSFISLRPEVTGNYDETPEKH